jgi:hypothetical protein
MNEKWREEVIALATQVGEEDIKKMTIEDLQEWVRNQNALELKEALKL